MSFTVDLNDPLLDTLVGSSSSNTAAAASSRRRVLRGAKAALPGRMERGQSRDGQRSQAPGSPPACDVPEGAVGRGKFSLSPLPPVQERLGNGGLHQEKPRGQPPRQAGEEAGLSGKRQKNGGRRLPNQSPTADPKPEEKLMDSRGKTGISSTDNC